MFVIPSHGFNICQRCWRRVVTLSTTNRVDLRMGVNPTSRLNRFSRSGSSTTRQNTRGCNQLVHPISGKRDSWLKLMRPYSLSATKMGGESTSGSKDVHLNIDENPYFDKYKKKLENMQKSAPDVYQQRVVVVEDEMRKDQEFLQEQIRKAEAAAEASIKAEDTTFNPKSLDSIMKTELVRDKTAQEIDEMWKEHHRKKDCIYAVLKSMDFEDLQHKAEVCPSFLYPLPRQNGFEFFFCTISGKVVVFVPLLAYQRLRENAVPCLTLAHFTEFQEDKDIVLMTGTYDKKVITRNEALNLVRQMTLYYSRQAAERFNLVRIFNHTPEKFNPLDVVNEYQEMMKFLESAS